MLKLELLPLLEWSATYMNASVWVRDRFLLCTGLVLSQSIRETIRRTRQDAFALMGTSTFRARRSIIRVTLLGLANAEYYD